MDKNDIRTSYQRHKRQQFWQILAPIGVGILLLIAAMTMMILAATGGDPTGQISGWADVSMIWLILPVLMIAIVIALLLFALIFLLARTLKILPMYTGLVQQYAGLIEEKVKYFAHRLVGPVIRVKSTLTGIKTVSKKHFERQKE